MPSSTRLRHDLYRENPLADPEYLPVWPDHRTGYHYFSSEQGPFDSRRPTELLVPDDRGPVIRKVQDYKPSPVTVSSEVRKNNLPLRMPEAQSQPNWWHEETRHIRTAGHASRTKPCSIHGYAYLPDVAGARKARRVHFQDDLDEAKDLWLEQKASAELPGLAKLRERRPTPPSVATSTRWFAPHGKTCVCRECSTSVVRARSKSAPVKPADGTSGPLWEYCTFLHKPVEFQCSANAVPSTQGGNAAMYHHNRTADKWATLCRKSGFPCEYRILTPFNNPNVELPKCLEPLEDGIYKDASVLSSRGYFHFRESNFRKQRSSLKPWNMEEWW